MKLSLRHIGFRGRLLAAMLALALVTSVTIAAAFMISTFQEEKARAQERLEVASDVVREILSRRNQLLANTLSVLVDDFGFRSAIATRDKPTMTSVLKNHSRRFNADLAVITDRDGAILASLQDLGQQHQLPFPRLLGEAMSQGAATGIVSYDNQAYQTLVVPVQAPGLRAWMVMGFALDNDFAHVISDLTGVDVIFESTDKHHIYYGRSLADNEISGLMHDGQVDITRSQMTDNHRYFTRTSPLTQQTDEPVQARLLLDRQTALANYYRMAVDLTLLVLACLAIASLLALGLARTLGRPVLQLAHFAGRIGEDAAAEPPSVGIRGELGTLAHALTAMVHKIQHREHRIRHDATHDALTGLPNRTAMDQYILQRLNDQTPGYLISLSIIGLRQLSETLGYNMGDQVLVATGLRLRATLSADHVIARAGGNEFMTFLPTTDADQLQDAIIVLKARAESSIQINQTPISIELSAAILKIPEHAETIDDVRRRISLTREKALQGETRTAIYVEGGEEHHLRELTIIRDLYHAIEEHQMEMVYQPKVRFDTAQVTQVEALIRWQHPELGFVSPDEFISLAERSGQIHTLTEYILRQVERDARPWHEAELSNIGLSINLSALDLSNRALPNLIRMVFADWPQPLSMLTFEITESAAMADAQLALLTLNDLRGLGARLSVDDFGTGYSSLAQMRQLPVQELKIDKSFVLRLDSTPQDQLIVKSTVDMAHGLGLSVVAEGIENEGSWRLLQSWGCELAQGYFLGRPMTPEQLVDWHRTFGEKASSLASADYSETEHEKRGRS